MGAAKLKSATLQYLLSREAANLPWGNTVPPFNLKLPLTDVHRTVAASNIVWRAFAPAVHVACHLEERYASNAHPTPVPTLFVASSNPGKLQEFRSAAAPAGVVIATLPGLERFPEPVEDAPSFAGNADLKAIAYSRALPGELVLADDSGLEVEALGGRPGVLSARFADTMGFEPEADTSRTERNNRCLLALLADAEQARGARVTRGARFVCALSVARDGDVLLRAEGTVEGDVLPVARGAEGFGYDPLFLVRSRGLTLAELSMEEKWAVGHRGHAFRALLDQILAMPTE